MIKNAIGLIETIGLAAAVEAADVAVKSANVELIGYELTRGDGMTTVKITGDVGAVKAAVESAKAAASLISKVYSTQVIPRPARGLEALIYSQDTVGLKDVIKETNKTPATPQENSSEKEEIVKPAETKKNEPKNKELKKDIPKKPEAKKDTPPPPKNIEDKKQEVTTDGDETPPEKK